MTVYVVTEEHPRDDGGSVIRGIFSSEWLADNYRARLADNYRASLMARIKLERGWDEGDYFGPAYEITEWELDLTEA